MTNRRLVLLCVMVLCGLNVNCPKENRPALTATEPFPTLQSLTLVPGEVARGESSTATATLDKPLSGGASYNIDLFSSNQEAATVPARVIIASGASSATFSVTTNARTNATEVVISARDPLDVTLSTPLRFKAPTLVSVGAVHDDLIGGTDTRGVLLLSRFALAGGFPVDLTSSDRALRVPAVVVVPADSTGTFFEIKTLEVPTDRRVTIRATAGGQTREATVDVLASTPVLTFITPGFAPQGTFRDVILTGRHFQPGVSIAISDAAGITVSDVVVVSSTEIRARISVDPGIATGPRSIRVTTSAGTSNALTFVIEEG